MDEMTEHGAIDLGDGHSMSYVRWAPDRALNPQYADLPDVEKYLVLVYHTKPDGSPCMGGATLDSPSARALEPGKPKWTVESWDPLTLAPSLLCLAEGCGDHGFIRAGRWVRA